LHPTVVREHDFLKFFNPSKLIKNNYTSTYLQNRIKEKGMGTPVTKA